MKRFFCTLILLIGLFTVVMPTFAATKTTTAQPTKETAVTADNKTEEAATDKKLKKEKKEKEKKVKKTSITPRTQAEVDAITQDFINILNQYNSNNSKK